MARRQTQQRPLPAAPHRATTLLALALGVVATLLAIGTLAIVLTRGTDQGQADATACRTVTWDALPDAATLPPGWTIASTRFLLDIMTTTVVGPAPSGSTQGLAAFVSVACFGSDAQLALAHDHDAAVRGGAQDVSLPQLGDASLAVTSAVTSSTTIYIRRGILVADVTGATSLDQSVLQSIAGSVDQAMVRVLAATSAPGSTATTRCQPRERPRRPSRACPGPMRPRAPRPRRRLRSATWPPTSRRCCRRRWGAAP